jgi:ComF family protein
MLLDSLYPRRCAVCDSVLGKAEQGCCQDCYSKLAWVAQPFCYICGKPLMNEEQEYCGDCSKWKKTFAVNRALLLYDDSMRASLARFKFQNRREYASFYAQEIANRLGAVILSWQPDALIPVPIHKNKRSARGFNQAERLAVELGKRLELPVVTDWLVRDVETVAQKQLNNIERLKNLENAFHLRDNGVKLDKVVIVDDIYTTGATLEACSRILKSGGSREVYGITVATGQGY